MSKIFIKCSLCGKIDKIEESKIYECSFCKSTNRIDECYIKGIKEEERNLDYLIHALKKNLDINNRKLVEFYTNCILDKDNLNSFALYFKSESKIEKKNILLNFDLDIELLKYIIKKDISIIKKYNNEEKLLILNKFSSDCERNIFRKYMYEYDDESIELYNNLKDIDIKPCEYLNLNKQRQIGYFLIIFAFIVSIIITLICSLAVNEDCKYATIVVLGIVPSFILSIGVKNVIKLKRSFWVFIFLIPVFYLLTYFMTVFQRDCGFVDSFKIHFDNIINAIPDILDSITKNSDIDWEEKE